MSTANITDAGNITDAVCLAFAKDYENINSWSDVINFAENGFVQTTGIPAEYLKTSEFSSAEAQERLSSLETQKRLSEEVRDKLRGLSMGKWGTAVDFVDIYSGAELLNFAGYPYPASPSRLASAAPLTEAKKVGRAYGELDLLIRFDDMAFLRKNGLIPDKTCVSCATRIKDRIPTLDSVTLMRFMTSKMPMPPLIRQKYSTIIAAAFGEKDTPAAVPNTQDNSPS